MSLISPNFLSSGLVHFLNWLDSLVTQSSRDNVEQQLWRQIIGLGFILRAITTANRRDLQ
jgi:hypothetical protein